MSLNIQADALAFLGSNALSVFISAVETGIVIVFFARFVARKKERMPIRLLVYFVTFVALCVTFHFEDREKTLTRSHFDISLPNWQQVSNGLDLRVLVEHVGSALW